MWMLKWLGIAALLIVLLGLSMLNLGQQVDLDLYFWTFQDLPLILVIFESFILGMLTWFLVAFVNEMKIRSELRSVKRERDEKIRELQALRNQPLEEFETDEERGGSDGYE
ncbi:MAG: LapA family protein [bacterium]